MTKYTYDNVGNMIEMTDARGGVTKYEYDDMGREITASYPDNTVKATRYMWNYDNVGVYAIQTSGTKIPTSKTVYDAFGRETRSQVTHFDNTIVSVDKVYDEYGNLEKVSLPFSGSTASCGIRIHTMRITDYWNTPRLLVILLDIAIVEIQLLLQLIMSQQPKQIMFWSTCLCN